MLPKKGYMIWFSWVWNCCQSWSEAQLMWSERQRERGQVINEREWVSWANAIVILIFENTLRTIHIVPAISTPKSAWRSMTQRAAILWQGPGQARVRVGGQIHPDHLTTTPSFPHFLLPCRLLMTPLRQLPKQGNAARCCPDHFTLTRCLRLD